MEKWNGYMNGAVLVEKWHGYVIGAVLVAKWNGYLSATVLVERWFDCLTEVELVLALQQAMSTKTDGRSLAFCRSFLSGETVRSEDLSME